MTEVYINQQRVFFREGTSLKLTVENSFFQNKGSYTLDVAFPLDIPQNRKVFGAINRIDVSKRQQQFDSTLIVDSRLVFKGTARITNVNASEVKLQLLSGNSRVNFWSRAGKVYIDELHYEYVDTNHSFDGWQTDDAFFGTPLIKAGTFPGRKGIYCYVPTLDESGSKPVENCFMGLWNEQHLMINVAEQAALYHGGEPMNLGYFIEVNRENICPNLMFVAGWIFHHMGYTLERNDRDSDFVNGIYIANARNTTTFKRHNQDSNSADEMSMAKALPHWTVEEFMEQLQKFLNATIVFDDIKKTVSIIDAAYTDGIIDITDSIEDEYEAEIIDDDDVAANLYDSNVKYKKGESDYHALDMVEQELIESFTQVKCSYEEACTQWDAMQTDERKRTIWITERGHYCAEIITDEDGKETGMTMIRFNHFGGIVRNSSGNSDIELKISPVATMTDVKMPVFEWDGSGPNVYRDSFNYRWTIGQTVVCLKNTFEAANKPSVWDALHGKEGESSEKEDVMQVFLMDDKAVASSFYHLTFQQPFTHYDYQRPNKNVEHQPWSLSMANDESVHNIGELHGTARRQNRNTEQRLRFVADVIPSVYSIFLVRNKRYACKKLELKFNDEGMEKEIYGYFEEIL